MLQLTFLQAGRVCWITSSYFLQVEIEEKKSLIYIYYYELLLDRRGGVLRLASEDTVSLQPQVV